MKLLSPILLMLSVLMLAFAVVVASTSVVLAVDVLDPACEYASGSTLCVENRNSPADGNAFTGPNGLLTRVGNLLSWVVGAASVIVIVIAGLQYTLASGDSAKINNAKNAIIYALVGLIVAVMAQVIIIFVIGSL